MIYTRAHATFLQNILLFAAIILHFVAKLHINIKSAGDFSPALG